MTNAWPEPRFASLSSACYCSGFSPCRLKWRRFNLELSLQCPSPALAGYVFSAIWTDELIRPEGPRKLVRKHSSIQECCDAYVGARLMILLEFYPR
jgi:hypothetical protein